MRKIFHRLTRSDFVRKYIIFIILVPLGYLLQVCVMPYLSVGGVTPNLLYVQIAIVTVAYGRVQALWVGLIYGLLMEIMLPSVTFFNLALYPITSLFTSFIFADKSQRQRDMDRAMRRKTRELPALMRTVFCAMVNTFAYEVFQVAYIYLGGNSVTWQNVQRALLDVLLTGLLALCIGFWVRLIIFGRRKEVPILKNQPIVFSKQ